MLGFRPLPWEYGVRNLFRRPGRSALTLAALALVVLLVFVVVGFLRGLESSLDVSGDPRVVLVHSAGTEETIENSTLDAELPGELPPYLPIYRRKGPDGGEEHYVSPELYLGTEVVFDDGPSFGLVRGVTPSVLLVRERTQLLDGRWPGPGQVLVGRLAPTKLGRPAEALALEKTVRFEGKTWTVSGHFASAGSALEAELWCPVDTLQRAMNRTDLSVVAITLAPGARLSSVRDSLRRVDLELHATSEVDYYQGLQTHYGAMRAVGWTVVALVAGAGVFAGLNAMFGAVAGRVRELATLQAVGFSRRAIALSLVQEAILLASAASLLASLIAVTLVNGVAVRFTMGAFALRIDAVTLLIGCGAGLLIGAIGALPPAVRAMRLPVADGLKAV